MHLSPREIDKLTLHQAGVLAQKRLARGLRLNHPEAVALIATQILELVRDGRRVAELMDLGRRMLGRRQVLPGVPELVSEVQVEGTFPDGTKLVTVHHPIAAEHGDLALALYGSFLPVPPLSAFAETPPAGPEEAIPGEVLPAPGDVVLNEGREAIPLAVTNLADRPVQVGSHYHFAEVNPLPALRPRTRLRPPPRSAGRDGGPVRARRDAHGGARGDRGAPDRAGRQRPRERTRQRGRPAGRRGGGAGAWLRARGGALT